MFRVLIFALLFALPAHAKGERAGDFDFYVLSLSWTPSWCAYEGDRRKSPQCDAGRGFGFTLHGLWPQYEQGWPSFCKTSERRPSKSLTGSMTDIMGSSGLAWHQWNKHGVCTGLSAQEYYDLSRKAYDMINRPEVLRKLKKNIRLPAQVIEDAFMEANPELDDAEMQATCKAKRIQEIRICLTKDLEFRNCGTDMRDCSLSNADMAPIR